MEGHEDADAVWGTCSCGTRGNGTSSKGARAGSGRRRSALHGGGGSGLSDDQDARPVRLVARHRNDVTCHTTAPQFISQRNTVWPELLLPHKARDAEAVT